MSRTLRIVTLVIVATATTSLSADEYRRYADIAIGGGEAWGLAFMPDGKRIVVGGNRGELGTVQVWDVASKERVKEFKGHEAAVWCVAASADGKLIASGGMDNTARIWDYATGKEIAKIDGFGDRVTSVAFSPDGSLLLVGSNDRSALIYDIAAKKVKLPLKGHTESVRGVAFAPDGKLCATVGKDNLAQVLDVATGKTIRGMKFPDVFYSVTFTPDGKKLIFAGGGETKGDFSIKMVDITEKAGKALMFKGHEGSVWALSISKDGKTLASCGYHDCQVRVWDVATQTSKAVLDHKTDVFSAAISPDGNWVAGATRNGFWLWERMGK